MRFIYYCRDRLNRQNKKMIKNLYLLRHGQAASPFGVKDKLRPLTSMGEQDIISLGRMMQSKSFNPDQIYCSTAKRTRQSLELFFGGDAGASRTVYLDTIYEASLEALVRLVGNTPDTVTDLLIVGHNPGLSYLYEYYTGPNYSDMVPGEMVKIVFENLGWHEVSQNSGYKKTIA